MKKSFIITFLLFVGIVAIMADEEENDPEFVDVELTYKPVKTGLGGIPYPRMPVCVPSASICDDTLLINGIGGDYILQLETDEGVAYSIAVHGDTGNDTVILPSSLSGTYMLCLYVGNFCFYGTINL